MSRAADQPEAPAPRPKLHARMSGADRTLGGRAFRAVAGLIEPFYAAAAERRNRAYDAGRLPVARAHCPVISVGNVTSGGTGKTPMVAWVVEQLRSLGRTPAVLIRGYKASAAGSDEAAVLRRQLGEVAVLVNADRAAAAERAQRDLPDVDVLVLDDGFQHRRFGRDLDLVLIDATNPFGFGHVLPRGLLRERPRNLARADAVVVTRADRVGASDLAVLDAGLAELHGRPPIAHAAHRWAGLVDEADRPVDPAPSTPVVAVCGLGHPGPFFEQVAERFALAFAWPLGDHHAYTAGDAARLGALCERHGASAVLTTEKDWVKLRGAVESSGLTRAIWRPRLAMTMLDGRDALRQRLQQACDTWTPSSD